MHTRRTQSLFVLLFIAVFCLYFSVSFGAENTDKTFITITTFVFSMFAGFFITRQGNRYTKIREIISTFDGKLTGCYRASTNVSAEFHQEVTKILTAHYHKVLETRRWDFHFTNKSNTITSIHALLERLIGDNKIESLRGQAIGRIMSNLSDAQVLRKNMVMLWYEEMVPFQWYLMIFFVIILITTISIIPSVGLLIPSLLKASFVVTIVAVMAILRDLDNLYLFETFVGEHSARDVLHIIAGTK